MPGEKAFDRASATRRTTIGSKRDLDFKVVKPFPLPCAAAKIEEPRVVQMVKIRVIFLSHDHRFTHKTNRKEYRVPSHTGSFKPQFHAIDEPHG